jgi:protoheme IX farnesyltransferase
LAFVDHSNDVHVTATGGARVEDYFALLKPRVMSLVVFTAIIGLLLAPGGTNPVVGLIAILCIAIGAGGSGALNMWYDADIDRVMSRTANRPIPAGRVSREEALTLGLVCSGFSVMILGLATNWVAAALLAFTIFFYAVIYTMWLKRSTPQNIVIGGAAGAFPPMIGWAAVTGDISLPSIVLFLIIFLWTPPHFWALALYKQGDYGAAGIPMLPNVAGEQATKVQILVYSLILVATSFVPSVIGMSGWLYSTVAALTGASFVYLALRLYRSDAATMKRVARSLFTYSLSYLFVIFLALMTDRVGQMIGWVA